MKIITRAIIIIVDNMIKHLLFFPKHLKFILIPPYKYYMGDFIKCN